MMQVLIPMVLISTMVFGPLLWRAWRDRTQERALALRAEIQGLVNHRLGGESLITIDVVPAGLRRPGRVVLSAPSDWTWLIDEVWMSVLARVPRDFELVVQPGRYGLEPTTRSEPLRTPGADRGASAAGADDGCRNARAIPDRSAAAQWSRR